jgi:hypothetical protein
VPSSKQALREALALSEELLRNIELSEMPLANLALKASRLARLLNDFDIQKMMEYEASGYPSTPTGVVPTIYKLAVEAGRESQQKDEKTGKVQNYIYTTSIEELEQELKHTEAALSPLVTQTFRFPPQIQIKLSGILSETLLKETRFAPVLLGHSVVYQHDVPSFTPTCYDGITSLNSRASPTTFFLESARRLTQ